jgi:hypothetical protein
MEERAKRRRIVKQRGCQQVVRPAHSKVDGNDARDHVRIAAECARLARLTQDEDSVAKGFARLAERMVGWRSQPSPPPLVPSPAASQEEGINRR